MAKRGQRRGVSGRGAPAGGGIGGGMLKQVQKLQEEMARTQEALGDETLSVTAGGGAIEVVITGHLRIQNITIAPEVVDAEDIEMLQDLVVAAVNEAIEAAQKLAADRLGALTGGLGLNLPGLF